MAEQRTDQPGGADFTPQRLGQSRQANVSLKGSPFYLTLTYLMLDQPALARKNLELALENMPDVWDDKQELFVRFILTPGQYEQLVDLWPEGY